MTRQIHQPDFSSPGYNPDPLRLELDVKNLPNAAAVLAELKKFEQLGLGLHFMQTNPPSSTPRPQLNKLLMEAVNAKIAKAQSQQAVAAQPPATAVQPTGVAPPTGGQSTPQSPMQTSVANVWTIDELYKFIAGELKLKTSGPLSLVDMAKQHCFEKGIAHTSNELGAYWQRLKEENALDTRRWVIGMTLLCFPLLYGAMSARMEHDLVWNSKMAEKHPEAYEADKEFVNSYWRFAVLVLLICFTLLYFKCKLGCALPSVLMFAAAVFYHWWYEDIDFPQMTDLSFPLMCYLVGWWMLLKMAQNLLSSIK